MTDPLVVRVITSGGSRGRSGPNEHRNRVRRLRDAERDENSAGAVCEERSGPFASSGLFALNDSYVDSGFRAHIVKTKSLT